jgi:hypothetical protein
LPVPCQPSNVFTGSNLDHRLILERTESVIAFFIQKGPFGEYCISRQNVCDRWVNLPANLKPLSMNGLRFLSTQNRMIAPATCLLGRRANLLHRLGTMAGARDPAPQRRHRFLVSTGSTERTSVSDIAGVVDDQNIARASVKQDGHPSDATVTAQWEDASAILQFSNGSLRLVN